MNNEQIQARAELIIDDMKIKHGTNDLYAPVMLWREFLSLLAERDADKALIAEQAKRIAELEARTLTVMLPEPPGPMSVGARTVYCGIMADVVGAFQEACAAAGITLVVGE